MALEILSQPLTLKSGETIPHRLAKTAMSEELGDKNHQATPEHIALYQRWIQGQAGLMVTGNFMISSQALAEPGNVIIQSHPNLKNLAQLSQGNESIIWPQLNHPGLQALKPMRSQVVGPDDLSPQEIHATIKQFANAAKISQDAGFTGAQIHAAHGYLISQFLSPRRNHRTDEWGGELRNRSRFLMKIIEETRELVGDQFSLAVKINAGDYEDGSFTEQESQQVCQSMAEYVDLIEISGGTYKAAAMLGRGTDTKNQEAYFLEHATKVKNVIGQTPLMLTGGFQTTKAMETSISSGVADLIGLARPWALNPNLAHDIFDGKITKLPRATPGSFIPFISQDSLLEIVWYEYQLRRIADGQNPQLKRDKLWPTLRFFGQVIARR